jgi:hypothetical protein
MLATVSKLLPKLWDRINFKGGSARLRNTAKKLGFLWKTQNNMMVLTEKHKVRRMQITIHHVGGHHDLISNALIISSYDYCDQKLNFLF